MGAKHRISEIKNIIIVEDDAVQRKVVRHSLQDNANYNLIEFSDGQDALDYLRDNHKTVDLLILDYILPKMNGIDILRCLKKSESQFIFPVIMLTTKVEAKGSEIKDLNVVSWIIKPIPENRWPDIVKKIFEIYPKES